MATASGLALRAVVAGATGATGKCLVGELLKAKVNSCVEACLDLLSEFLST